MTAPVASGWSVRRVGFAPTGKRRLVTAHGLSGRQPAILIVDASAHSQSSFSRQQLRMIVADELRVAIGGERTKTIDLPALPTLRRNDVN